MTNEGRRPPCFVVGASGEALSPPVDHDAVVSKIVLPAVERAGLEVMSGTLEDLGGPALDRFLLADVAVVDTTTASSTVHQALGMRRAIRPGTTVVLAASAVPVEPAPDVAYEVDAAGCPATPDEDRDALVARLRNAHALDGERPQLALLDGVRDPAISRLRTDVFRDQVDYSPRRKEQLAAARAADSDAVRAVLADLGDLTAVEVAVLVDVLLSFRAVQAHADMVELVERLCPAARRLAIVREQHAFALGRLGRHDAAAAVLIALIDERGPSSEAYALLGRIRKEQWDAAVADGRDAEAAGWLAAAIDAYARGFEADWRDAYPGINAVELMELREPPDSRRQQLLPVVRYAADRRQATAPDYWDHATMLELAVLDDDQSAAMAALDRALASTFEGWQPASTSATLRRIRLARERRGAAARWLGKIERALAAAADA